MDNSILNRFRQISPSFRLTLIDVGARGGIQEKWKATKEHLWVIGFEPDEDEYQRLLSTGKSNDRVRYLNTGLHGVEGSLDFHLLKSRWTSSTLRPNLEVLKDYPELERFEIEKTIRLRVNTLDSELSLNGIDEVDFIKLDTQGSELSILRGAANTLENSVLGLEIEVEFVQLYQDQPLMADVDRYVKGLGFQLFDLRPNYWRRKTVPNIGSPKGQLVFADALYLRTYESMFDRDEDTQRKRLKVLKAVSICFLHGYHDYALELCEKSILDQLFSKKELDFVYHFAADSSPWVVPYFRGRGRIVNVLFTLLKYFDPCAQMGIRKSCDWSTYGRFLGNIE